MNGERFASMFYALTTVLKAGIITRSIQVSTMANSSQQKFSKKTLSYKQIILGLQPRDKAAMLVVNTIQFCFAEFA